MRSPTFPAVFLVIVTVLAAHDAGAQDRKGKDLEEYLQSIRDKGMSEVAENKLRTVASILNGGSTLTFFKQEDTEVLGIRFGSTYCPDPNADPEVVAAWREREIAKSNEIIARLKLVADEDESGFVSQAEGSRFLTIIEHGYLCAEVAKNPDADTEWLAAACGLPEEQAVRRLDEYRACRTRLVGSGVIGLPDVPAIPRPKAADSEPQSSPED